MPLDIGLTDEELREEILNRAAQKLADDAASSEYVGDRVSTLIDKRVEAAIKLAIGDKIDALLNDRLESMLTQPIQAVDIYGDKAGEPISIRDTLNERSKEFWAALVDSDGKRTKDVNSYNRDRHKTRAEWLMGKVIADDFADLVKQNISNIVGTVKEKLRADAVASVEKHLNDLLRVKTR